MSNIYVYIRRIGIGLATCAISGGDAIMRIDPGFRRARRVRWDYCDSMKLALFVYKTAEKHLTCFNKQQRAQFRAVLTARVADGTEGMTRRHVKRANHALALAGALKDLSSGNTKYSVRLNHKTYFAADAVVTMMTLVLCSPSNPRHALLAHQSGGIMSVALSELCAKGRKVNHCAREKMKAQCDAYARKLLDEK